MVLSKMKNLKKDKGFTIVELLIVIVVIAILAAITIVAYGGITARANNSKAQTNVANTQKVGEVYNSDAGFYPAITANFTAGFGSNPSSKLPTAITLVKGATAAAAALSAVTTDAAAKLTSGTATTNVYWEFTGAAGAPTGGVLITWDSVTNAVQVPANYTYYGSATAASTYTAPAS